MDFGSKNKDPSYEWRGALPAGGFTCLACGDSKAYTLSGIARHEKNQTHQTALKHHQKTSFLQPTSDKVLPALHEMLDDMSEEPSFLFNNYGQGYENDFKSDPSEIANLDLENLDPDAQLGAAILARALKHFLQDDEYSGDEGEDDMSEGELEREELRTAEEQDMSVGYEHTDMCAGYMAGTDTLDADELQDEPKAKRARHEPKDSRAAAEWYPWPNKIACTIDILMHLPRSVFSQRQLDILLWLLHANGISDLPTARGMKKVGDLLQTMHGVRTISYEGALGHKYFINSLADIISQEMANPRVRPHLRFYPEDSGKRVDEYWQARHWHDEVDPDRLTPMVRMHGQTFYIYEPALLQDGTVCMPTRWFVCDGKFVAKAWSMHPTVSDSSSGWVIDEFDDMEVQQDTFVVGYELWNCTSSTQDLPAATQLIGSLKTPAGPLMQWTQTDPAIGNRWRAIAKGARIYAFPIWLYCDDTSGNLSKKWNKHNSFLFTPAGLPRAHVHMEYNVHFLCTSNLAPPLEMLDGVVDQLEEGWETGIWAWDHVHKEHVLIIPSVVALLGDNPMQSEFACHIGSMGKFFCRVCHVKGTDAKAKPPILVPAPEHEQDHADPGRDLNARDDHPEPHPGVLSSTSNPTSGQPGGAVTYPDVTPSATSKKGPKKAETLDEMIDRVSRFVKIGEPRTKQDTCSKLATMFEMVQQVGNQTKILQYRTATGVKDTYFEDFLAKINASYKEESGPHSKQAELSDFVAKLQNNIFSPVWRLKGIDPHSDTPVEILHTILLGFVKYFWRDVMQNQLKKNETKRELLKNRLSSFDVTGLGINKISGHTLVQYAGSLTGRDFRVIAQVAPFVLYDLVPKECYETWVALSNLIPMVWQPSIPDINEYTLKLTIAIDNFLACASRWTPRWFNKPKFHVLVHLVAHIRRFGPAILFATEGFESFNAVIRAKSVHSNRHAPSRDIAHAFAHGSRIRHLLSGAQIMAHELQPVQPLGPQNMPQDDDTPVYEATPNIPLPTWSNVGAGPLALVRNPNAVTHYLGLDDKDTSKYGTCVRDQEPMRRFAETQTGQRFPNALEHAELSLSQSDEFFTNKSLLLYNGDKCTIGQWILARNSDGGPPYVACLEEILSRIGTANFRWSRPDAILLRCGSIGQYTPDSHMPMVTIGNEFLLIPTEDLLCAANLQHNCSAHACDTSGFRFVRQEGQTTMIKQPVVSHVVPTDILLNTARMRDAVHMEPLRFQIDPENVGLNDAILQGSTLEIKVRKAAVVNEQAEREKAEKGAAKAKEKADEKEKAEKVKADKLAAKDQDKKDKKEKKEKDQAEKLRLKNAEKLERERLAQLERERKEKVKLDAKNLRLAEQAEKLKAKAKAPKK